MPQPYDYSTQQVDVGNYFDALKSGREEKAQMDAANRQSALQKYMPGALNGDAEARTQVMANANPDQQIALQNRFDNEPLQKIEQAMKMNGAITQLLSQVRDGDQQGFEAAKARAAQIGIPMDQMGHLTVADLPRLRAESGQTARELDIQFKQAQIKAQQANAAQSYAAADASRRANQIPKGIDPATGRPEIPASVRAKDYAAIDKMSLSADAAATAAAGLRAVKPALDQGMTGPNFRAQRNIAGALSYIPGLSAGTRWLFGEDKINANINTFDQIEGAALDAAIKKLEELGGSDTNQELMTAMRTTISPDLLPEENLRRYRSKLAAAEIVAKKAQLASEWRNNFGSLDSAAPDGTTWQKFWPAYQKQEWARHRQQEAAIVAEERRKKGGGQANSIVDAADAIISKPRGRNDGR